MKEINEIFKLYSNNILREIIDNNPSNLTNCGGMKKDVIIVSITIDGFATISEGLDPQESLGFIVQYCKIIFDSAYNHNGFINDLIGTDIEVIFINDNAEALNNSLKMISDIYKNIEKIFIDKFSLLKLDNIKMSCVSGPIVFGTIGTDKRMFPMTMGNTKNFGYRLMTINKHYNSKILCTKNEVTKHNNFLYRKLDNVRVVGIAKEIEIYEILTDYKNNKLKKCIEMFNGAMEIYNSKQWEKSKKYFEKCLEIIPDDGASKLMIKRCISFINNPPNIELNGIYSITEKS